jgi:hypothetical protein
MSKYSLAELVLKSLNCNNLLDALLLDYIASGGRPWPEHTMFNTGKIGNNISYEFIDYSLEEPHHYAKLWYKNNHIVVVYKYDGPTTTVVSATLNGTEITDYNTSIFDLKK